MGNDHEIAQSLESPRNKPTRIEHGKLHPLIFLQQQKKTSRNAGKGRLFSLVFWETNQVYFPF